MCSLYDRLFLTVLAGGSRPSGFADAIAVDAGPMDAAVDALMGRGVALGSLPVVQAVADATAELSMARAQDRTRA